MYLLFHLELTPGDDRALLGSEHEASPGELPSEKDASIILPRSLFARADGRSDIGSFFGLYNNTNLFPVGGGYADGGINATTVTQTHSPILSATVGDDRVNLENLDEPVIVTLRLDFYDSVSQTESFSIAQYYGCCMCCRNSLSLVQRSASLGTLKFKTGITKDVQQKSVKIDNLLLVHVTT